MILRMMALASFPGPAQLPVACSTEDVGGLWVGELLLESTFT